MLKARAKQLQDSAARVTGASSSMLLHVVYHLGRKARFRPVEKAIPYSTSPSEVGI
jgi:hypothetical protein